MLGTIVLIGLQFGGSFWLSNKVMELVGISGLLRLGFLVVVVSLLVWVIGVIASEFIKDVPKPSPNVLMSCMFVSGLITAVAIIPLFADYVEKIQEAFLSGIPLHRYPLIGAIVGYYLSQ